MSCIILSIGQKRSIFDVSKSCWSLCLSCFESFSSVHWGDKTWSKLKHLLKGVLVAQPDIWQNINFSTFTSKQKYWNCPCSILRVNRACVDHDMIFLIAHFEWKDSVWHLTLRVPCDGLICHAGPFSHGSVLATSLFPCTCTCCNWHPSLRNMDLNISYLDTRFPIMILNAPLEKNYICFIS